MRRRYFATFQLGSGDGESPELEEVFEHSRNWIFHPSHRIGEPEDFSYDPEISQDWDLGRGHKILYRSYRDDAVSAFGLSYQHPDRDEPELTWRTDICAGRKHENGENLQVAVTLYAGHNEPRMSPENLPVSRPRIVRRLISAFPAHAGRHLERKPREIRDTEVPTFVDFLTDPNRQLPVLFCSALNLTDKPIVYPERLADQLVGLAHVYVAANRFTTFRLEDHVGRSLNTFNGAVRIYWPNFTKSDRPFTHKLWIARELADRDQPFQDEVLETIARVSTTRVAPAPIRWEEFERRHSARRIRKLQEQGADQELLDTYEDILDDQTAELEGLRLQVTELREELETERRRAESWRKAWVETQQTEEETDLSVFDQAPPRSVAEALERVQDEFEDRIVFPLNSKSEVERSQFRDVEGFFEAIRWLATTFWESKTGDRSVQDLDKACREACGFRYSRAQSEVTMGQFPSYYETTWNGETVKLQRHLGQGSGKDPRHTIRVGFSWDQETNTVVVGFVGQHQRTEAT